MTEFLFVVGVLVFIVGIGASIALHELGHLIPAKAFGVKVTHYMIGFGPTLFSRRRGETVYGVKLLPLGGFIQMVGMYPPNKDGEVRRSSTGIFQSVLTDARNVANENVLPGEEHRTFYRLAVPKRLVVMLGGPVMNFLLAAILMTIGLTTIGPAAPTTVAQDVSQCVVPVGADRGNATSCTPEDPVAPAAAAGIRTGDEILAIDGRPTPTWAKATAVIRDSAGRSVPVVVRRDGQELTLTADIIRTERPALDAAGNPIVDGDAVRTVPAGFLGVSPQFAPQPLSIAEVPAEVGTSFVRVVEAILNLPARLVDVAQAAFGPEERDPNGPIGMVGVGRIAGEIASTDLIDLQEKVFTGIMLLGSLNMFLFVFNLVPLLPLDGGHILGALLDGLRRLVARARRRPAPRPLDIARALPLTYVVVGLMLCMTLLLLYADIVKPISLF